MEHEIDLAPRRLIAWLEAELARPGPHRFAVRASREFLAEPVGAPDVPLDAEDDVSALVTIGQIELAPLNGDGRWRLTLRIEDPVGAHLPDDGSVPEDAEILSLAEFAEAFAACDDLDYALVLDAETAGDRRKAERLIARMMTEAGGPVPG